MNTVLDTQSIELDINQSVELKRLTASLGDWFGLSSRSSLEHDRVNLELPLGALHWPAAYYHESEPERPADEARLVVEVSGLVAEVSFQLLGITDISGLRRRVNHRGDSHIHVQVNGVALSPKDLRGFIHWLVDTIKPMEFMICTR